TGTGKTYAFGVAMLQLVGKPRKNRSRRPARRATAPSRGRSSARRSRWRPCNSASPRARCGTP
ncbi:hypothetical protein, partial [Microbispora sp. NPDC049633]|uniref:hypothetical protein n=1 Tax=Microbispora sp. NPDC049633 TaxID=3154355 RepID=UPI0034121068